MELLELTKFLVKSVVPNVDEVSFKQYEKDETIIIEVLATDDMMKYIIGKKGSIAHAIRTLVQASNYINGEKKVILNIDSI